MSILTGMIAPTSGHYNIRYNSEVNPPPAQTDRQTNTHTDEEMSVQIEEGNESEIDRRAAVNSGCLRTMWQAARGIFSRYRKVMKDRTVS